MIIRATIGTQIFTQFRVWAKSKPFFFILQYKELFGSYLTVVYRYPQFRAFEGLPNSSRHLMPEMMLGPGQWLWGRSRNML